MSSRRLEGESPFLVIGTLLRQRVTQSLAAVRVIRQTRIYRRIRIFESPGQREIGWKWQWKTVCPVGRFRPNENPFGRRCTEYAVGQGPEFWGLWGLLRGGGEQSLDSWSTALSGPEGVPLPAVPEVRGDVSCRDILRIRAAVKRSGSPGWWPRAVSTRTPARCRKARKLAVGRLRVIPSGNGFYATLIREGRQTRHCCHSE